MQMIGYEKSKVENQQWKLMWEDRKDFTSYFYVFYQVAETDMVAYITLSIVDNKEWA